MKIRGKTRVVHTVCVVCVVSSNTRVHLSHHTGFMQFHPGLRIYAQLFARSFKYFKDFIAFLSYLIIGLAFGSNALARSSGGTLDFMIASGAISGISRLTFGFYEFSDFIDGYRGMGAFGQTREFWFWCVYNVV